MASHRHCYSAGNFALLGPNEAERCPAGKGGRLCVHSRTESQRGVGYCLCGAEQSGFRRSLRFEFCNELLCRPKSSRLHLPNGWFGAHKVEHIVLLAFSKHLAFCRVDRHKPVSRRKTVLGATGPASIACVALTATFQDSPLSGIAGGQLTFPV